MEIRYVRPDDSLLAISNIYERSWKYAYQNIIPQDYLDSIPTGRWANSITKNGMNAGICKSRWENYRDYGEIVSIYFLPEYIGKGYGASLLEKCVEELKNLGFDRILLWVLEENSRARSFYERNGFTCSGEYMNDTIGGKELKEVMYTYLCATI